MHIFLTGGTGFIGGHFLNVALRAGHKVSALRRDTASFTRIPLVAKPNWVEGELGRLDREMWRGVDVLVHLAASGVTPQPATWESCYKINVTQSLDLVTSALDAEVPRIVAAGTYAEYGISGMRFDQIPPDAPLEPTGPYAASKASASIALTALCRARKFELAYYRVFSVFGEGQHEKNFWPQMRKAALAGEDFCMTKGGQTRDFISVKDAVDLLLLACVRSDIVPGTPWVKNLASGNPMTLRAFAEKWWLHFKAAGTLKVGAFPERPNELARFVAQLDYPI